MIRAGNGMADAIARRRGVLGAGALGRSLIFLEITVVGVALPAIQGDFGVPTDRLIWVVNAYLLPMTVLVVAGGRLGDRYGHRLWAQAGLLIFVAASIGCALAPSLPWLITARAVQGIGAAIILPTVVALVTFSYPPERRGWALGFLISGSGLAMGIGPLVGGLLVERLGWPWVFVVPIPVALLALGGTWRYAGESNRSKDALIDRRSLALFAAGMSALVIGVMQVFQAGFTSFSVLGSLLLAVVLLLAYVRQERRAAHPLIDVRLLADRVFLVSSLAMFVYQWVFLGFTVFTLICLQICLRFSPGKAGALFAGAITPVLVTALLAGRITDLLGPRRPLLAGFGCFVVAAVWVALVHRQAGWSGLLPPFVVFAFGVGLTAVSIQTAAMNAARPEIRGVAGGVLAAARQTGGLIGVAISSVIFGTIEANRVSAFIESLPRSDRTAQLHELTGLLANSPSAVRALGGFRQEIAERLFASAKDAVSGAYVAVLVVLAVLAALAMMAVWRFLPTAPVATPQPLPIPVEPQVE
jgi:EmrB/QacA subfamily drug resistance transporter